MMSDSPQIRFPAELIGKDHDKFGRTVDLLRQVTGIRFHAPEDLPFEPLLQTHGGGVRVP